MRNNVLVHAYAGFTCLFRGGVMWCVYICCCCLKWLWQRSIQHHGPTVLSSFAPPRVEAVSRLVRQDHFVPSRRFREDGLEALNLSTGRRRQRNTLGETNDAYINSDSLLVQVEEPVVPTPWRKQYNSYFEGTWHAWCFIRCILLVADFIDGHSQPRSWPALFYFWPLPQPNWPTLSLVSGAWTTTTNLVSKHTFQYTSVGY